MAACAGAAIGRPIVCLAFLLLAPPPTRAEGAPASCVEPVAALQREGFVQLPQVLGERVRERLLSATEAFVADLAKAAARWDVKRALARVDSNMAMCWGDVVQRDPGKLELALPALSEPEMAQELQSATWRPVVEGVLGEGFELGHVSVITSSATSLLGEPAQSQRWHADGSFRAGKADGSCRNCVDLEAGQAYGVVVYVPLEDVPDDGGRVEYIPGTHLNLTLWEELDMAFERDGDGASFEESVHKLGLSVRRPDLAAGDALLYDFRLRHRGLARRIPSGNRPILKLDCFRRGFGDRDNAWCDRRGSALGGCGDMLAQNKRPRAECDAWARAGECKANPKFMLNACALSCCLAKAPSLK
uniref:ShKT domain-containing protein n=1 Tax=Pyrodinium bahamense TaxID=73915 RepID=A0A7S0ANB3_9DINO